MENGKEGGREGGGEGQCSEGRREGIVREGGREGEKEGKTNEIHFHSAFTVSLSAYVSHELAQHSLSVCGSTAEDVL